MQCNVKECYWNMWSPNHEMFNNERSMQCVSEDLEDHYNENSEFKVLPNDENCPSHSPYISFCGKHKRD
ncbi:hypothetical protein [Gracilibacillus sp. YIM 98692]|uniref:hypothetical protein n=1 Tax=Gracilibacillus sp. YIM 98692 TaxID=2663532 RepID=UPI0013D5C1DB|nr:hypothetical protein [Gracilibacillus sp. YIM 98692]